MRVRRVGASRLRTRGQRAQVRLNNPMSERLTLRNDNLEAPEIGERSDPRVNRIVQQRRTKARKVVITVLRHV